MKPFPHKHGTKSSPVAKSTCSNFKVSIKSVCRFSLPTLGTLEEKVNRKQKQINCKTPATTSFDLNFTNQFSLNCNASFYIFSLFEVTEDNFIFHCKPEHLLCIINTKIAILENVENVCNLILHAVLILIIFTSFGTER